MSYAMETYEFLKQVLDTMPGEIVVRDADSRIYFANRAFAATYGLRAEDVIGTLDADHWAARGRPPEQIALWLREDRAVLESGQPIEYVQEINRPNGEHAYFLNYKTAINLADGKRYLFAQYTNITERRRMELKLARAEAVNAELAGIHKATVTYAHEINNPLTGVLALAQLMLEHEDCPMGFREPLCELMDAARRIATTIKQLEAIEIPMTKQYLGRLELLDLEQGSGQH